MTSGASPRVLMIAQWPSIKNAEYELIERVRHTGFKVTVVDFLGFDVQTGKCINHASLPDEYDFAVSLHYETPKFLNLPTFHWVANPLEFIQGQSHYRTHLIHHLRSYDDFVYNGSQYLKEHIRELVGHEWVDGGLNFYQSCSRKALLPPRLHDETAGQSAKLFYCGINWEAISDKDGRAQGLLEILQERQIADFYGPETVLNVNVWGGFSSYRGEIPFDGESMFPAMHAYAAVLALSSPAHLKSRTSSGRALEGFTAGVPVISDDNHHVRTQFGDLAYYFEGATEGERADSIQGALDDIRTRPDLAIERVREAQSLVSREYCFEACLEKIRDTVEATRKGRSNQVRRREGSRARDTVVDVFLFFHDPYCPDKQALVAFPNVASLERAIASLAYQHGVRFRLFHSWPDGELLTPEGDAGNVLERVRLPDECLPSDAWGSLRLGEKVSRLAQESTGDFAVFLTQSDFVQHDYFVKTLAWFSDKVSDDAPALHIGGFYVNDFSATAPMSAGGILRCSASNGLYRWTQNSIAEHQLGQMCFNRSALGAIDLRRLERYDVLAPVVLVLDCMSKQLAVHRSRHVLLRSNHGYYHRYYDAFRAASAKGLWAQHYELLSNATHEINGLYDSFHEVPEAVEIADKILGIDIPPPPPVPPPPPLPPPTDPAVYQVAHFLHRISPYVVRAKKVARLFGIRM